MTNESIFFREFYSAMQKLDFSYKTVGGSYDTFVNWLKGARLSLPSLSVVLIQPIGRGMAKLLNGSCGKPDFSPFHG